MDGTIAADVCQEGCKKKGPGPKPQALGCLTDKERKG